MTLAGSYLAFEALDKLNTYLQRNLLPLLLLLLNDSYG